MTLPVLVVLTVVGVAVALYPGAGGSEREPTAAVPRQPNVVLVVTDDMRPDELRYMPNVRRLLVDQGTSYTNAVSPHPLCCPARAELMTGQYGQNNGVTNNVGERGGVQALRNPDDNIGVWLQRAGYQTSYQGKFLNGYGRSFGPVAGWDVWDPIVAGTTYKYWTSEWYDGDTYRHRYITHVLTERSEEILDRFTARDQPFYMVVNQTAPHGRTGSASTLPAVEPQFRNLFPDLRPGFTRDPAWFERDVSDLPKDLPTSTVDRAGELKRARARAQALWSVDIAVKQLVDDLRAAGELDDTYLVFTSDNGFLLGEHDMHGKNYPIQQALDVPLVVRGPGIPAGAVDPTPVSLVDLPATILRWAHAEPSPQRPPDGLPITDRQALARRDTMLIQTGHAVWPGHPRNPWWYRGVLTDRYLYAVKPGHPDIGVLFDRQRDPDALRNVLLDPRYAAARVDLQRRLEALEHCAGADCNQVFGPAPGPTDE